METNYTKNNPRYKYYSIGEYTVGEPLVTQSRFDKTTLIIGKFCTLGKNIEIFLGYNHHTDWVTTSTFGKKGAGCTKGSVIIGNDVWIGKNTTIMSGITIGDGAIIEISSVVAKSIPPFCIAMGSPCRVVSKRFTDEQIEKLLKIKWWNWELNKIIENRDLLLSKNLDDFIDKHLKGI
jgi:acetyltransferase-like isoleucine patch superfamily enzyme